MTDEEKVKRGANIENLAIEILTYMVKRTKERKMKPYEGLASLSVAYAISVATSSSGSAELARKKHETVLDLLLTTPLFIQERAIDAMTKAEKEADANG